MNATSNAANRVKSNIKASEAFSGPTKPPPPPPPSTLETSRHDLTY